MLWVKSFHLIFVITWFAALFYLPRLFVYHAMSSDAVSINRFIIMERKLYYGIMMPSGVLATGFGIWLLSYSFSGYLHLGWMQAKLFFVGLLWVYHFWCGKYLKDFKKGRNRHTHIYYRWFNEVPVFILIAVVILVVVQPHLF